MSWTKIRPIPELSQDKIEEFWNKVDIRKPEECWPWCGSTGPKGYGLFDAVKASRLKPHLRRKVLSHRVSWKIFNKRDSVLPILHKCDYPPCNNPHHLFEGTVDDNNKDRQSKGRTKVPDTRGSSHGMSKLNEALVVQIRKRNAGGETNQEIADSLNVSRMTIHRVVTRQQWKHTH